MPVALDHLRCHRRRFQPQPRADSLLMLRLQMTKSPHRAREFAYAHILGRGVKPNKIPLHLGKPVQQLQAKCGRLGMNPVRAANSGRVLELHSTSFEHRQQLHEAGADQHRGLLDLQCLRRVHHVV